MRGWYFTHTSPHPQWGDHFEFWRVGSHCRRNHPCQIFCQLVQGFWSSDPPPPPLMKFYYLHRIGWSILQQCKHSCATVWLLQACWILTHFITLTRKQYSVCCIFEQQRDHCSDENFDKQMTMQHSWTAIPKNSTWHSYNINTISMSVNKQKEQYKTRLHILVDVASHKMKFYQIYLNIKAADKSDKSLLNKHKG